MARERSLFDVLTGDWQRLAGHPSSAIHLRRWQHLAGCFDAYVTVGEVVASFDDHTEKARSARLQNGLLIAASDDPLARLALLQALTAGLKRATRSLSRRMSSLNGEVSLPWSSRADLESDAIAELLQQIDRAAGRPLAHPAAMLLSRVRARLWRTVYTSKESPQLSLDLDAHASGRSPFERSELETLLVDAVSGGSVSRHDAGLIWRYRVVEEPMHVTAAVSGVTEACVQKRRERAERRLVAAHRRTGTVDSIG